MLHVFKHGPARAANHVIALIIDANQIELSAIVIECHVFLAQQLHAMALKKYFGGFFRARINFVIAVASPGAKGRAQLTQFGDAIFERIVLAADEISGYNRDVWRKLVGHVDGAPHFITRHKVANVDIAELGNLHAIELFGQACDWNFNFFDAVMQASGGETVSGGCERQGTGQICGGANERAPRRIDEAVARRKQIGKAGGAPSEQQHELYGEESEKRGDQPDSSGCDQPLTAEDARDRMAKHGIEKSQDQQDKAGKPADLKHGPQGVGVNGCDPVPGAKQPETLREIDEKNKREEDEQSYGHRVSGI